ncbi:MAG: hypothetical protein DHS80DRAFT_12922, partial [Piptocephalis tieghemiana]
GNRKITLKTIKNREKAHPFSRKANQMNRAILRTERLQKAKAARLGLEMRPILESFISRYDEEMFELEANRRPGRPKSGRETELELLRQREAETYTAGMDVPDLTSPSTVKILRAWDGDHNSILRIRTIRLTAPSQTTPGTGKKQKTRAERAMCSDDQINAVQCPQGLGK